MKFRINNAILILPLVLLMISASSAQEIAFRNADATLYFFWGEGCPHCKKEQKFLETLKKKHPGLVIRDYEVWRNKKNAALYAGIIRDARVRSAGVPGTIVGNRLFIGFNEPTAKAIEDAVEFCIKKGCPDAVDEYARRTGIMFLEQKEILSIPLIGQVDPEKISLPVITVVIAAMDSLNPCAFFVLLFLLSLLIHARSRQRMLIIGVVFVLFSGIIYFVFMAAWLNIFLIIGKLTAITMTAGVVAILVASLNIKDFFFFKKGISLVIPEKAKPRLYERMRGLLKSPTLPAMIAGTVALAVTANAYELLCTAGFPMVYTRVLTLHKLAQFQYYLYLALYNVVYVIPLAVIVAVITITLGAKKLTEWQGRRLKLISGMMMLLLGGVLLVKPDLLNNVIASVALLVSALIVSSITILITKKLKPETARD